MIDYPDLEDVVELHAEAMRGLGLPPEPFRRPQLFWATRLANRLERPRSDAHYQGADLIRQAAVLAVEIAALRPFAAFNFLTAYAVLDAFLRRNGRFIIPADRELRDYFERVVGEHDRETAINLFEAHLRPRVRER